MTLFRAAICKRFKLKARLRQVREEKTENSKFQRKRKDQSRTQKTDSTRRSKLNLHKRIPSVLSQKLLNLSPIARESLKSRGKVEPKDKLKTTASQSQKMQFKYLKLRLRSRRLVQSKLLSLRFRCSQRIKSWSFSETQFQAVTRLSV